MCSPSSKRRCTARPDTPALRRKVSVTIPPGPRPAHELLQLFAVYERIRIHGAINMFDLHRKYPKLFSEAEMLYVINNYGALRKASATPSK